MNTPFLAISFNDIFTNSATVNVTQAQETGSGTPIRTDTPGTATAQPFAIAGLSYWTFILILAVLAVVFILLKIYLKRKFTSNQGK